jgi:hypothetical protein
LRRCRAWRNDAAMRPLVTGAYGSIASADAARLRALPALLLTPA